jgi:putative ABC transport system permease protein
MTDLAYAARTLLTRPGFVLIVVLTLGLGIGANTAIFSAVHALLLRPFPFKDSNRLVRISTVKGGAEGQLSIPEQDDLAALSDIIEDIALYTDLGMYNAIGFGEPEELQATITTHNLFRVLGVQPLIGSSYPAETDRSRRFELVISHGLWTRRFGNDPNIVGRTMTLDGAPGYTIRGVLPPEFNFPSHSDLFRSSGIATDAKTYERRDIRGRLAVARLRPGVTVPQARDRIEALGERLAHEFPQTNAGLQFRVIPIRDLYVADVRPYVQLLFGAVMLVLLIACGNVVNLLLSRALAREREIAVRLALGAGRGRIIRQLLTESVLLSMMGGVAGLAFAYGGIELLVRLIRVPLPSWMQIELDGMTLGFLVVVSVLTGLAAGLLPALESGDRDLHGSLKDGGRGASDGARHHRLRNMLVIGEVALAVVLLVGAGLMVKSFVRLQRVHPGFDADSMLSFRVELGWRAYDTLEKGTIFKDRVLARLAELPGVVSVGLDSNLPLSGKPREPVQIVADGQSRDAQRANPFVHQHVVSAGYFETMRIPIERGRAFVDADVATSQPVAVVSRRLAERLWPGSDAVGQRIRIGASEDTGPWVTVVGMAGDVRLQHLSGAPSLDVYRSYRQIGAGGSWFVMRTRGVNPSSLAQIAPRVVTQVDPNQSFFDVQVMRDRIAAGIWQQRASGALFGGFGMLALVLASIGLYGLLSYVVTQQRREIGVRIALGADPGTVVRMVVARGLRLTGAGIVLGTAAAVVAVRAMRTALYDVRATDPWTFAGVPLVLLLIALLACYYPARRAARVDPLIALRAE